MRILSARLDSKVEWFKMEALAANTQKTRASQWRKYFSFCKEHSLQALPVSPENVGRFVVHLSEHMVFSSINNMVSAINYLSKLHKGPDIREDFCLSVILSGIRRHLCSPTTEKDPLLPSD